MMTRQEMLAVAGTKGFWLAAETTVDGLLLMEFRNVQGRDWMATIDPREEATLDPLREDVLDDIAEKILRDIDEITALDEQWGFKKKGA